MVSRAAFRARCALCWRLAWLLLAPGLAGAAELRQLDFAGQRLSVEVAVSTAERQRGLMGRQALGESAGMLFVFPRSATHCLWMKNTALPLSAAFLDERGRVLEVLALEPFDLSLRCVQQPSRYAVEANRGWFERRGIGPGVLVEGLPPAE